MKNSRRLTDEDVRAQCAKPWSPPGSVRVRLGLGDTRPYVLSQQAYRVGLPALIRHIRDNTPYAEQAREPIGPQGGQVLAQPRKHRVRRCSTLKVDP